MTLLQPIRGQRYDDEDEQGQMFLCVQIGFHGWNVAMKDIFIDAARDGKNHQGRHDNPVIAPQRMSEQNHQHKADGGVDNVLGQTHFAASEMKRRILCSIVEKWQKGEYEYQRSHPPRVHDPQLFVNPLVVEDFCGNSMPRPNRAVREGMFPSTGYPRAVAKTLDPALF